MTTLADRTPGLISPEPGTEVERSFVPEPLTCDEDETGPPYKTVRRIRHIVRASLITVDKLLHGYFNLSVDQFFEAQAAGNLLVHNFTVRIPRFYHDRLKTAFVVSSTGPWNRLPPNNAETQIVSSFMDR